MKNQKLALAVFVAAMGVAAQSQAAFDITFNGGAAYTGSGEITQATDNGNGTFTATQGTFTFMGENFVLDPVPAGSSIVTIHGIANTGGGDLFGDNILGPNYLTGNGLLFTQPGVAGNVNGFNGDVINLWSNGNGTYTMGFGGPDFPSGINTVDGLATITLVAVPEPATTAKFAGFSALGLLGLITFRQKTSRLA